MKLINIVKDLPRVEPVTERPLSTIDGIAIHHSGDEGRPAGWAWYHTTPPDQGGAPWGPARVIGYHAAVMRDGTAYKCAYDKDQTPGVANHNRHLLHIVLQGDLSKRGPTAAQIRSLLAVVRQYMEAYVLPIERVRDHGEWVTDPEWATSCPGIPRMGEYVRFMLTVGL